MKTKSVITMSILAATLQFAPIALAEDANNQQQPGGWHGRREAMLANLSPEERTKLRTAHEKAMQDTSVQAAHDKMRQAHREFRDAMKSAMLKADPTIQPILDKLPKHEHGAE